MSGYEKKTLEEGARKLQANIDAYLYKLDLNQDLVNNVIFNSSRVLPTDSDEIRDAKNKIFNNIEFHFTEVLATDNMFEFIIYFAEDKQEEYFPRLYDQSYQEIQKKIWRKLDIFNAQVPVESTKPIKAKIGSKESIKNNTRYDAYKFTLKDNEIKAVKTATVVVTTVADNTVDNTKESEFLQIAGYDIKEGYILKQRSNRVAQISPYYRIGALGGYGLNWVLRSSTKANGRSGFGGIYFNHMSYDITKLNDGENQYILDNPMLYDDGKWSAFAIGIRLGRTKRFMRFFEAGMHLNLGWDFMSASYSEELGDVPEFDEAGGAWTGTLGANLRVNLVYPVHLILGVDYSGAVYRDDYYKNISNVLKDVGANRLGLGYSIGLSFSL